MKRIEAGRNINKLILFAVLIAGMTGFPLDAREFFLSDWGAYLDMPQGWEPLEVTETKATFADPDQRAFLQVKVYPHDAYAGAEEIFTFAANELKADAEGEDFFYLGDEAVFCDLLFALNNQPFQGFGVMINGQERDWIILSFCDMDYFLQYQYFLLSALDSFSTDARGLLSSGPVNRYYETSFKNPDLFTIDLSFRGEKIFVELDGHAMDASEVLTEREAYVLGTYTPEDSDAWQRFYRMIYRDNYRKMDTLYRELLFKGLRNSDDPGDIARELLAWIQEFDYVRTGGLTDFSVPSAVLYNQAGDCDSLGLLYVILLKHYGLDAILMVSAPYSHAMAGVDVSGAGARFPFMEKNYLVAETTDSVSLGLIEASMADPAGWLGIFFHP